MPTGDASLQLPACSAHWQYAANAIESPATLARWLTEWVPRFPFDTYWSAIKSVEVWDADRQDCHEALRPVKGLTFWHAGQILLNSAYEVRDVLAHELGHMAAHRFHVLPDGDFAGQLMWDVFVDVFGYGTEETFANLFGSHLLAELHPFFRWFPPVVEHWRAKGGGISQCVYWNGLFQWFDAHEGRLKRFQAGRWLAFFNEQWQEV